MPQWYTQWIHSCWPQSQTHKEPHITVFKQFLCKSDTKLTWTDFSSVDTPGCWDSLHCIELWTGSESPSKVLSSSKIFFRSNVFPNRGWRSWERADWPSGVQLVCRTSDSFLTSRRFLSTCSTAYQESTKVVSLIRQLEKTYRLT